VHTIAFFSIGHCKKECGKEEFSVSSCNSDEENNQNKKQTPTVKNTFWP